MPYKQNPPTQGYGDPVLYTSAFGNTLLGWGWAGLGWVEFRIGLPASLFLSLTQHTHSLSIYSLINTAHNDIT